MPGKSACDCGTWVMPSLRICSGENPSVRTPSISIDPPPQRSRPLITRSTVDLPAPLGPKMQVTVCGGQCRSSPCNTLPPPSPAVALLSVSIETPLHRRRAGPLVVAEIRVQHDRVLADLSRRTGGDAGAAGGRADRG